MADSLKVRVATCIEAEYICDLDVDDPIRDVVLETESKWDSVLGASALGGANRIWVKLITVPAFPANDTYTFNLRNGTYGPGGGPYVNMLNGFGQHVIFGEVSLLEITGIAPNQLSDIGYLVMSAATPWTDPFGHFGATSRITIYGLGQLHLCSGNNNPYAATGFAQSFDLIRNSPTAMTFQVAILGYKA